MNAKAFVMLFVLATAAACHEHSLTRQELGSLDEIEVVVCSPGLTAADIAPPEPVRTQITTSSGQTDRTASAIVSAVGSIAQGINYNQSRRSLAERHSRMVQAVTADEIRADLLEATRVELGKVTAARMVVSPTALTDCSEASRQVVYDTSASKALLFFRVDYVLRDSNSASYNLYVQGVALMFAKSNALWSARRAPDPARPLDDGSAVFFQIFRNEYLDVPVRRDPRQALRAASYVTAGKLAAHLNRP